MKIEADENVVYIALWVVIGAVLLALVAMGWFAIDRYDKRVKAAIQAGYSIDTVSTASYQAPQK